MGTRHHDISDVRCRDFQDALEHRMLLAGQEVPPPGFRQKGGYSLSIVGVVTAAMKQPRPPTGPCADAFIGR